MASISASFSEFRHGKCVCIIDLCRNNQSDGDTKRRLVMSQRSGKFVSKFVAWCNSEPVDATCTDWWQKPNQNALAHAAAWKKFDTKCKPRFAMSDFFSGARTDSPWAKIIFSKHLPVLLVVASLITLVHDEISVCPCVLMENKRSKSNDEDEKSCKCDFLGSWKFVCEKRENARLKAWIWS